MYRLNKLAVISVSAALIFAPAVVAQTPAPAHAKGGFETTSMPVGIGDLNLSSAAGAKTVLQRMKSAANRVCGGPPAPKEIAAMIRHTKCIDGAMSRAVAALDAPAVTSLYAGEIGAQVAAR